MERFLPACVVTCGLVLSGCSKPPSGEMPASASSSHPPAAPAQPAIASSPTTATPQNVAVPAIPAGQSATTSAEAIPSAQPESQSQAGTDASHLVISDETQGPFHIGDQTFTFAKRVQKIQGAKSIEDATVEW